MTDIDFRLAELETRVAYQEKTIGELNEMITAQWKKIDGMALQLKRVNEELQAITLIDAAGNQKPPHY